MRVLAVVALAVLALSGVSTGAEARFHRRSHHVSERAIEHKLLSLLDSPSLPSFLSRHPSLAERAADVFSDAVSFSDDDEDVDVAEGDSASYSESDSDSQVNSNANVIGSIQSQLLVAVGEAYPNGVHANGPADMAAKLVAAVKDVLIKFNLKVEQIQAGVEAKLKEAASKLPVHSRTLPKSSGNKKAKKVKAKKNAVAEANEASFSYDEDEDANAMSLVEASADSAEFGVAPVIAVAATGVAIVSTAIAVAVIQMLVAIGTSVHDGIGRVG